MSGNKYSVTEILMLQRITDLTSEQQLLIEQNKAAAFSDVKKQELEGIKLIWGAMNVDSDILKQIQGEADDNLK